MVLLFFLAVFFVIWLFFSKTKSQDLKKLGEGVSKTIVAFNEIAAAAEKSSFKLHEDSKKLLVKTKLESMQIRSIPLSKKNILEEFKDRQDLIELAIIESASQTRALPSKVESVNASKKIMPLAAGANLRELNKEGQSVVPKKDILDASNSFHDKARNSFDTSKLIDAEKSTEDKCPLVEVKEKSTVDLNISELQVSVKGSGRVSDVFIEVKKFPDESLKNFVLVRFFLSNKKDFPNLKCVADKLLDSFEVKDFSGIKVRDQKAYLTKIWSYYLENLVFDQSKTKKIKGVYHFTHINNLKYIFEYGLLSRDFLDLSDIPYFFNDEHRWDGVRDSISLSISHPNHKMFIKYRKKTVEKDWVVLKISEDLLCGVNFIKNPELHNYDYLNKAIFCKKNAASFSEKNTSIEDRKKYTAFLEMFESPIGMTLPTYTVDNQAEILYQGRIPKEFIVSVFIQEVDPRFDWLERLGVPVLVDPELFKVR